MKSQEPVRNIVVLKLPSGVRNIIAQAKAIVSEVAANPSYFPSPTPSLAQISADIAALESAETATITRAPGTVEARDLKLRVLVEDLDQLRASVQVAADANRPNAPAIAAAAAMAVRKPRTPSNKQDLTVKDGPVTGAVLLIAKAAAARASYEWQWSLDQKSWNVLPGTLKARTSASALPVGPAFFRCRAITKAGTGEWTRVVSHVVK